MSVSYTHLCSLRFISAIRTPSTSNTTRNTALHGGVPVSYTHLDVYKRQVESRFKTRENHDSGIADITILESSKPRPSNIDQKYIDLRYTENPIYPGWDTDGMSEYERYKEYFQTELELDILILDHPTEKETLEAVSYTHLAKCDSIIDNEIAAKLKKCNVTTLITVGKLIDVLIDQQETVSYTHLDVYKRQWIRRPKLWQSLSVSVARWICRLWHSCLEHLENTMRFRQSFEG